MSPCLINWPSCQWPQTSKDALKTCYQGRQDILCLWQLRNIIMLSTTFLCNATLDFGCHFPWEIECLRCIITGEIWQSFEFHFFATSFKHKKQPSFTPGFPLLLPPALDGECFLSDCTRGSLGWPILIVSWKTQLMHANITPHTHFVLIIHSGIQVSGTKHFPFTLVDPSLMSMILWS